MGTNRAISAHSCAGGHVGSEADLCGAQADVGYGPKADMRQKWSTQRASIRHS